MCSSKTQGLISPREDWSARLQEHFMNDKEQDFVRRFEFLFLSLEKWPSNHHVVSIIYAQLQELRNEIFRPYWHYRWAIRSVDSMLIRWNDWSWRYPKIPLERPGNSTLELLSNRVGIRKDDHIENTSPDMEFQNTGEKKKQTQSNSCIVTDLFHSLFKKIDKQPPSLFNRSRLIPFQRFHLKNGDQ